MTHTAVTRPARNGARRGFSFVEVLLAVVLLGIATLGAAHAVGQARRAGEDAAGTVMARHLLQDAFAWARSLARRDEYVPNGFGPEPGESYPAGFDDVDDLDGLDEWPPTDRTGVVLAPEWRRTWRVDSVSVGAPGTVAADGATHLLRVRVSILRSGTEVAADGILLARTP